MISFTIDGIKKLGDYDEKYGQRWWATTPEGDLPLMFNTMAADFGDQLENGPFMIVAEEKDERTSNKGIDYLALKKVKLVEPSGAAQTTLTKEKVDEVFGSEKPAQSTQDALNEAYDRKCIGDLPNATEVTHAKLDRIESQIQELDSKIDRLLQ